jgi:hypothetical protein
VSPKARSWHPPSHLSAAVLVLPPPHVHIGRKQQRNAPRSPRIVSSVVSTCLARWLRGHRWRAIYASQCLRFLLLVFFLGGGFGFFCPPVLWWSGEGEGKRASTYVHWVCGRRCDVEQGIGGGGSDGCTARDGFYACMYLHVSNVSVLRGASADCVVDFVCAMCMYARVCVYISIYIICNVAYVSKYVADSYLYYIHDALMMTGLRVLVCMYVFMYVHKYL